MGKIESIRLNEYATKAKLWPNCPKEEDQVLALWVFLKEKGKLFGYSLKEIDYFFRDEPKKAWINSEDDLQKLIEKAQLLETENLNSLVLVDKIKLVQTFLAFHDLSVQLIFAGHEELVFDIRGLEYEEKLKEGFPSMKLKFLEASDG